MPKYTYKARDTKGNLNSGEMEVVDENELMRELDLRDISSLVLK